MFILICPFCGSISEVHMPFKIHQCVVCKKKFLPVKKESSASDKELLTTKPADSYNFSAML